MILVSFSIPFLSISALIPYCILFNFFIAPAITNMIFTTFLSNSIGRTFINSSRSSVRFWVAVESDADDTFSSFRASSFSNAYLDFFTSLIPVISFFWCYHMSYHSSCFFIPVFLILITIVNMLKTRVFLNFFFCRLCVVLCGGIFTIQVVGSAGVGTIAFYLHLKL